MYNHPEQGKDKYLPFFIESKDVNRDLFQNISIIQTKSYTYINNSGPGLDGLPDGAVEFQTLNSNKMKAVLKINDVRDLDIHRNNGISKLAESR